MNVTELLREHGLTPNVELVSVDELSDHLSFTKKSVMEYINKHKIPTYELFGTVYIWAGEAKFNTDDECFEKKEPLSCRLLFNNTSLSNKRISDYIDRTWQNYRKENVDIPDIRIETSAYRWNFKITGRRSDLRILCKLLKETYPDIKWGNWWRDICNTLKEI